MPGEAPLARRFGPRLRPDPRRVIARLFVPGEESPDSASRGYSVVDRILRLDPADADTAIADIETRFGTRHHALHAVLSDHFRVAAHGRTSLDRLTENQQLLIGAYFTMEYAVEAAALCNPSMVAHPDQNGLAPGQVRFVMSVRAIGEGHVSSVEFRTGVIGPGLVLTVDDPGTTLTAGTPCPTTHHRELFRAQATESGADPDTVRQVLRTLPENFRTDELLQAIEALHPHLHARHAGQAAIEQIKAVAEGEFEIRLPPDTTISERLLWPGAPAERQGIEDVRLVRFVDDQGMVTYRGTYTAYDGTHIVSKLLITTDFVNFHVSHLLGTPVRNKGMALFPRMIGDRYVALSRWDRENLSVCTSRDGWIWDPSDTVLRPCTGWNLVQVGNCGSPVETDAGWLVLTHGVGPMRTYAIGALLLDLKDPTRPIAALPEPLLIGAAEEQDGYVPNVAYSCGGLLHGTALTIPYGISDTTIGFAQVDLPELLNQMR